MDAGVIGVENGGTADRRRQATVATVVAGWDIRGPIGWWLVDEDWSELRAWGGAVEMWFGLGPVADLVDLLRGFPIAVRDQLADLANQPEGMARCPVYDTEGQLRHLTIASTPAGPGQLAYIATEITASGHADAVREALEPQLKAELEDAQVNAAEEKQARIELERANSALREEVETLRQQYGRLEETLEGLSQALARTIHDVRAPLNTIVGFTELLGRDESVPERVRWLDHVRTAADHILDTANRMLQLARAESGQAPISIESLAVRELVDEAWTVVGHEASSRGIDLTVQVDPDVLVLADRHMLSHIITNLLANAVAHTSDRTTVRVEAEPSHSLVSLRVIDAGAGVPAHLVGSLFEAFKRDDHDHGRPGTGLGLAICREYAEQMGGSIGVDNLVGAGACFWLDLPRPLVRTSSAGRTVVVASADLATLELLERSLDEDWDVRPVRSLRTLVRDAQKGGCSAVVIDMNLSPPDEIDRSVQQLRSALATSVPIIALSTGAFETSRQADASIRVPMRPTDLRRALAGFGVGQ